MFVFFVCIIIIISRQGMIKNPLHDYFLQSQYAYFYSGEDKWLI